MKLNDQELKMLQNLLLKKEQPNKNPHTPAKVVRDNRIALNYLLAEQGDVCCDQEHLLHLDEHFWGS